ncbi:response regulator transcription factor [Xanthobacter autotrophicus]|uniref:response regulator transcription factor n=1 Tax=Xanthobacter autotrophicus TaxID=280 RepID=UPI0024A6E6CF|nr:response regulator transcription factor [Xanthobacter autotrophicus]MDI4657977.1 response regulator transcription factor [Xanthobacter autotrophicus]
MCAISVAVVDDHPIVVEGIVTVLEKTGTFSVVSTGSGVNDILGTAQSHGPDVIVVDLTMQGDVIGAVSQVREAFPATRIVIFTASNNAELAAKALSSGASAFVLKGSPQGDLIQAITCAMAGETYITPSFAARIIAELEAKARQQRARQAMHLSIREDQIVQLLLLGKKNSEIARALALSEKTVKGYMSTLMQKLHVRNRVEVVIAAQNLNGTPEAGAQVSRRSA